MLEIEGNIGYEWCKPSQRVLSDLMSNCPQLKAVTVESSAGVLVLARVERLPYGIQRVIVRADELGEV
jgi:hypothetical protein